MLPRKRFAAPLQTEWFSFWTLPYYRLSSNSLQRESEIRGKAASAEDKFGADLALTPADLAIVLVNLDDGNVDGDV